MPSSTTGCASDSQSKTRITPIKIETFSSELSCTGDAERVAANTTKAAENTSSTQENLPGEMKQDPSTCLSTKIVSCSTKELTASAKSFETTDNLIGGT